MSRSQCLVVLSGKRRTPWIRTLLLAPARDARLKASPPGLDNDTRMLVLGAAGDQS
jgi:hypothetical protein